MIFVRIAIKILRVIMICSLLVSCASISTPQSNTTLPKKAPTTVYRNASYIAEYSLVGLILKSELIVRGRITGSEDIINMARDVNDYSKPDPRMFGIGQIYGFDVTQTIKVGGAVDVGAQIKVVQAEGLITSPTTNPPSKEEIEAAKKIEQGSPLIGNQEYILFLKPMKEFDNLKGYYTGTAHPWQFVIEKGCAYPETPWEYAKYYYLPQETDKFIAEIIASLSAKVTPQPRMAYPAPGGEKSTCPPRVKTEAPYP